MKANELMAGDWVLIKRTPSCEYPYKICSINNYSILGEEYADWIEVEAGEEINLEHIQPIPLTAEILEKNGWKWNAFYTMLDLVIGTIHIGWGFYKDCLSVSDWSDEGHCQISSLRCIYVHELQHALRLCGIDKEIVL